MYKTTRICKCCGHTFEPEFGRQVHCSATCRERYTKRYKRLKKDQKNTASEVDAIQAVLSNKHNLSISEAALFLGVSRPTVYLRIRSGELSPIRVSSRTVRIPIEQLKTDTLQKPQPSKGDFSSIISKEEALSRYEITIQWLYRTLKKEGIRPRIIHGEAFFPKNDLDRLFPAKLFYNPEEWYTAEELISSEGITRKYISSFIRLKKVRCQRSGKTLLIARKEWDNARICRGDLSKNYLTVDQAKKRYHIGQGTFYEGVNESNIQGIRQGNYVYFSILELDRLFKNKTPKIPPEIRRDYIRGQDALKKYHIGQKRFSEMTKAAGVTKIRTKGNYVWYKKSELDTLFFMINARI